MSAERLPEYRRIVTGHNENAVAVIREDAAITPNTEARAHGFESGTVWVTGDGLPTNDNNNVEDGSTKKLEVPNLIQPKGTNFRYTDIAPGAITAMHRTNSVDYNILIQGEIILILDDGSETHLRNPGDTVIQKGTMHAWRNPGSKWARWACVLVDANPAVVGGKTMESAWINP